MSGPGAVAADSRIKKIVPSLSSELQIFSSQSGFLLYKAFAVQNFLNFILTKQNLSIYAFGFLCDTWKRNRAVKPHATQGRKTYTLSWTRSLSYQPDSYYWGHHLATEDQAIPHMS